MDKKMENKITWLHISDLHLCKHKHGWDSDQILEDLIRDLQKMQQNHNLQPDFIFFTGDLAYGQLGEKTGWNIDDQYEDVDIFIEYVRTQFVPEVKKENIFIVPGNHDVNRDSILPRAEDLLDQYNANPYNSEKAVLEMIQYKTNDWKAFVRRLSNYKKFLRNTGYIHLLQDEERLIYSATREIRGIRVGIMGLNSAWSCGRDGEKGRLWLGGKWQIGELRKNIKSTDLRIGLMHHPISWLNPKEDLGELKVGMERNLHFLLHGHEHDEWVDIGTEHIRVAAGASYGDSEQENSYNFVRLNLSKGIGELWLRGYRYKSRGWIPLYVNDLTDSNGTRRLNIDFLSTILKNDGLPLESEKQTGPESRGTFGRHREIEKILAVLEKKSIVGVFGLSGIGKSQIIQEVIQEEMFIDYDYVRFRAYSSMTSLDLYRQIAPILGSRDEIVNLPVTDDGRPDYSGLLDFKNAKCIIHLDMAQELFSKTRSSKNSEVVKFFNYLVKYLPNTKLILESRSNIPINLFSEEIFEKKRILGLDIVSLVSFFRSPLKNEPDVGWELSKIEANKVFHSLGGRKQKQGAHPLAMFLLASVASSKTSTPLNILSQYEGVLIKRLEKELFNELYESILDDDEKKMLHMCAFYRDSIPDYHIDILNKSVVNNVFDQLVNRCLITPNKKQEWYYVHSIIADLTKTRIVSRSDAFFDIHEYIADAWLYQIRNTGRLSIPNIRAASEAAYHLTEGECFERLDELARKTLGGDLIDRLKILSRELYQEEKYEEQKYVSELLVSIDPMNPDFHRYLGNAIERVEVIGDDEALEHYEIAFSLASLHPPNLGCIGRNRIARGEENVFVDLVDTLNFSQFTALMDETNYYLYNKAISKLDDKQEASRLRMEQIKKSVRHPSFYIDEAKYLKSIGEISYALIIINKTRELGISNKETDTLYALLQKTERVSK
jgi:predicted MPP superfamily phosphohydrolase